MRLYNPTAIIEKSLMALRLAFKDPAELSDRIFATYSKIRRVPKIDLNTVNSLKCPEEVVRELGIQWERDLREILEEKELKALDATILSPVTDISGQSSEGDIELAHMCYLLCRALRPKVVLETGVRHGVTSTYILQALEVNQQGTLHSVDLPPLGRGVEDCVGRLIPDRLKSRWCLYRGASRRVFPSLLPKIRAVDFFVHDSLHTYENIGYELKAVAPYLARPSGVIVDDIQGHTAFEEWVTQIDVPYWATIQESGKESTFGLSVTGS